MVRRMKILANWTMRGMWSHLFFRTLINDKLLKLMEVLDCIVHSFTVILLV